MRHAHQPVSYRHRGGTGTPTRGTRFVLVGQRDFYDFSSPADRAEYQTVRRYSHR